MTILPNRSRHVLAAILLLMPALAACSVQNLKQQTPVKSYFALDSERATPSGPVLAPDSILAVRNFLVSPAFASRQLVYRVRENAYRSDYYNLFLVSPEELITQQVRQWLESADIFGQIAPEASGLFPTHVLEGSVRTVHGDFRERPGIAVLEIQFFLMREVKGEMRVRLSTTYREETPLKDQSAEGLVAGLNTSLSAILTRFEADLRTHLKERAPS